MGKVYDALRRAEQQRSERAGDEAVPAAPRAPAAPLAPPPPEAPGASAEIAPQAAPGRRWLRGRGRKPRAIAEEGALNKRRIALLKPDSFVAEQFRSLRGQIDAIAGQQPLRTLAITSALQGEGKTTAAVNLAIVTAMGVGRRVLIVDCDLRRPHVHQSLGVVPEAGLAEVLEDKTSLDNAVVKVEGANLDALLVRSRPRNPSELLASPRMHELIEEIAKRYDRVILDVPPVLGLPDARTVTEVCDGVVFVVRADATPRSDVESALDAIDRRRVLGLVLNGADVETERYEYSA